MRRRRKDDRTALAGLEFLHHQLEHDDMPAPLLNARLRLLLESDSWAQRCACGRFGLPGNLGHRIVVLDFDAKHGLTRCQPPMEVIP